MKGGWKPNGWTGRYDRELFRDSNIPDRPEERMEDVVFNRIKPSDSILTIILYTGFRLSHKQSILLHIPRHSKCIYSDYNFTTHFQKISRL